MFEFVLLLDCPLSHIIWFICFLLHYLAEDFLLRQNNSLIFPRTSMFLVTQNLFQCSGEVRWVVVQYCRRTWLFGFLFFISVSLRSYNVSSQTTFRFSCIRKCMPIYILQYCTLRDHKCTSSCINLPWDVTPLFFVNTLTVFFKYNVRNNIIAKWADLYVLQDKSWNRKNEKDHCHATKLNELFLNSRSLFSINCLDQHADEQISDSCVRCKYLCDESWLLSSGSQCGHIKNWAAHLNHINTVLLWV